MRVLVTGGAGFIGSAFVRLLVGERGHDVLTLDALTYAGRRESLRSVTGRPNHRLVQADICNQPAVSAIIADFRPQRIVHLAAESHVDRSIADASVFIQTNIVGTFALLEAVRTYWNDLEEVQRRVFRFLHVSTDEVYGSLGTTGFFSESSGYDPSSPYSASKAASDHLVRAWGRTYDLPVLIAHCSNNYGPYQFPEKLIPLTIRNALRGRQLPIFGTGENIRDWLFVEDAVRALDLILNQGRIGETYDIGGGNERRNIDIVRQICALLDEQVPAATPYARAIEYVGDRPGHDMRYAIDASKIARELGWTAQTCFDDGLEQTVRWFVANNWWWRDA